MSERASGVRERLRAFADEIEDDWCRCAPVYVERDVLDPQCQAHDIADHIRQQTTIDRLAHRERAVEALESIRDDFSHEHESGHCRACIARDALNDPKQPEVER